MTMRLESAAAYDEALRDFVETARLHNPADHPRLLALRDALDAYEVAAGDEPPLPTSLMGRLEVELFERRLP